MNKTMAYKSVDQFIHALEALTDAQRSMLRRANGRRLGEDVRTYDLFNEMWRPLRAKQPLPKFACYLVATLYPWHASPNGDETVASALRKLALSCASRRDRQRADIRFLRLIAASGADLDSQMLGAVRHLAREEIRIDWRRLLADLGDWYEPGEPTQNEWKQEYFRNRKE